MKPEKGPLGKGIKQVTNHELLGFHVCFRGGKLLLLLLYASFLPQAPVELKQKPRHL